MTARDHRGRFVSADEHAATRLLEAAVAEAVRILREGDEVARWAEPGRILTEATRSADLLLGVRRG